MFTNSASDLDTRVNKVTKLVPSDRAVTRLLKLFVEQYVLASVVDP